MSDRPLARRDWVVLALWVLVAVAARAPFLNEPLGSDEAGFLMVGQQWGDGGDSLYGPYWVDRPPLLIGLHELAGGAVGLRVLGCLAAAATVALAGILGRRIAGRSGASWSAALAAALVSAPTIGAPHVGGELLAIPWILGALVLVSRAASATSPRTRAASAAAAGASAAVAPFIKQNFVDGVLACLVLVVAMAVVREITWRTARDLAAAGVAGATALAVTTFGWAWVRGASPVEIWTAIVTFRGEASEVLARHATAPTDERFWSLVTVFVIGGGLVLVAVALLWPLRSFSPWAAVGAVLTVWALVSIFAGGSFWRHYLEQIVPAAVVVTAVVLRDARRPVWARAVVTYVVALCLGLAVVQGVTGAGHVNDRNAAGDWLGEAASAGDTAVVAWGQPSIVRDAGLTSPYENLWSLPVRVRDPRLTEFRSLIEGPEPPTWLVLVGRGLASWGIDSADVRPLVQERYREVAELCGYRVLLLDGVDRALPPEPR